MSTDTRSFVQAHSDLVNAVATYQDRADALAVTISVENLIMSQVAQSLFLSVSARIGAEQHPIRYNMGCRLNGTVFCKLWFRAGSATMNASEIPMHHMQHFAEVHRLAMDLCSELAAAAGGSCMSNHGAADESNDIPEFQRGFPLELD